ncbi:MAG: hypothetical protein JO147_10410 [Actinobacteria bacterium]|nr:hypothetical protein [Actinomycetota bacterium]
MTDALTATIPPPPAQPRRRRSRGLYWFALLVALVAFVGAGVVAVRSYLAVADPGAVVSDYFEALARGDASAALGYGDVPDADHDFLTSEVLRRQLDVAKLGGVEVLSSSEDGRTARVNISYPVSWPSGSRTVTDSVRLHKAQGRWRLDATAAVVSIAPSGALDRLSFAGTSLPRHPVALFPGALPITFDTDVIGFAPGQAIAHLADTGALAPKVSVTAAGRRAVAQALTTALGKCLAASSTNPVCPLPPNPSGLRVVPGSLHGRTTTTPKPEASLTSAAAGVIEVTGTADVTGSYATLDFNNQAATQTGTVAVTFAAHCFAKDVSALAWDVPGA